MTDSKIAVFALSSSREFGERVCRHLDITLARHEEREFEDGEHKIRPLMNVRDKDVFVIESVHGDSTQSVNDKLCRLLFFLGALRDASAGRLTAVMPYLCYGRKDRKSKARDPVTTRYVATMFEAMKVDRAVTLDVHNLAAVQNAWRIPVEHLEAKKLLVDHFVPLVPKNDLVVVSPDAGAVKRAEEFRQAMMKVLGRDVGNAFIEKYRSAGVVSGQAVVGDVAGKVAVLLDDMISSGTTMVRAAEACRAHGATAVYAAATHGVFGKGAREALSNAAVEKVIVTDSVAPTLAMDKVEILSVAGMFAEAIQRIHTGGSIVEMLE